MTAPWLTVAASLMKIETILSGKALNSIMHIQENIRTAIWDSADIRIILSRFFAP